MKVSPVREEPKPPAVIGVNIRLLASEAEQLCRALFTAYHSLLTISDQQSFIRDLQQRIVNTGILKPGEALEI